GTTARAGRAESSSGHRSTGGRAARHARPGAASASRAHGASSAERRDTLPPCRAGPAPRPAGARNLLETSMHKRTSLRRLAAVAIAAGLPWVPAGQAFAQSDPIRIGLNLPMTGPFASTGRQVEAAAKLYV